jgi:hypothetical protein
MTKTQHKVLVAWIFGVSLLVFNMVILAIGPETMPLYKQTLLGVINALMSGFFVYFLTGSLQVIGPLSGFKVKASAGVGVFVIVLFWWRSPLAPIGVDDGTFRVRVTVLGSQGVPQDDGVRVWSSLGGEAKKVSGGWEIEIASSKRPEDKKLTLYAEKATHFETGKVEVELDKPGEKSVTLWLKRNQSGKILGIVTDTYGRAMKGANVTIVGSSVPSVTTDTTGRFDITPGVAPGEEVRLRVEKYGYKIGEQYHPAGDIPVTVQLEAD